MLLLPFAPLRLFEFEFEADELTFLVTIPRRRVSFLSVVAFRRGRVLDELEEKERREK